jgi:enterochelin esterase-like enzyme
MHRRTFCTALIVLVVTASSALAQPAPPAPTTRPTNRPQGPVVISPEILADRRIAFRILAPKAQDVRLNGGDIPGGGGGPRTLTKAANGVWEITLGPIDPGTYRYTFNVDGVAVIDPRSPALSESNNNAWSVVHVPGSPVADEMPVPHGGVAAVHYHSAALNKDRRMHVYTPPGYERGDQRYPVLYLLHGASDSDDSWSSVGRANFILDNLIAAGKAKPMIVVMPAGHTSQQLTREPATRPATPPPPTAVTEFDNDFVTDIRPYVESHYRALTDAPNRAIAGLSMGGGQTLSISLAHVADFAYVGVFSSAIFQRDLPAWEKQHQAELDNAEGKKAQKLLWFRTGSADFLVARTRETVDLLKRHGFNPVYEESTGGHTWINWRNYLSEFAPQLFK